MAVEERSKRIAKVTRVKEAKLGKPRNRYEAEVRRSRTAQRCESIYRKRHGKMRQKSRSTDADKTVRENCRVRVKKACRRTTALASYVRVQKLVGTQKPQPKEQKSRKALRE